MTTAPRRSMTRVCRSRHRLASAFRPMAAMRPSLIARAWAEGRPAARVAMRPLLGAAGHRPAFDEGGAELGAVVGVQEGLGLLEPCLPVLADIDVVVERAAQAGGIASLFARHRGDPAPLLAELVGSELVGHPAV